METLKLRKALIKIKYNIKPKKNIDFLEHLKFLQILTDSPNYELVATKDTITRPNFNDNNGNVENVIFYYNHNNQSIRLYYSQWKKPYNNYIIQFSFDCTIDDNEAHLEDFIENLSDVEIVKKFDFKLIYSDLSNHFSQILYRRILQYETSLRDLIWTLLMYKFTKENLQQIIERLGFNIEDVKFKHINESKTTLVYDFVQQLGFSDYPKLLCTKFALDKEIKSSLNTYKNNINPTTFVEDIEKILSGKSLLERFEVFTETEIDQIEDSLKTIREYRNTVMHCKQLSLKTYHEIFSYLSCVYALDMKIHYINNDETYRSIKNTENNLKQFFAPIFEIQNKLQNLVTSTSKN